MSNGQTSPDELRRRVAGWRAAERREREIRQQQPRPEPAAALAQALELCDLAAPELAQVDALRERDVQQARAAWQRLRRRLGWPQPR